MVKPFRVYDELYGYIKLTASEKLVIDMPVFQRLRRIKQLSLASMVYPGAEHTRFSHSIGVAHVAGMIAERLRRLGFLREDDVEVLRFAALLHDIGHLPFSHAMEYVFARMGVRAERKLHEELTLNIVKRHPDVREALSKAGIDAAEVASILEGRHRNRLLSSILAGDLDADRLDYLPRDALHTGVAYGLIDRERLVDTITVDESGRLALMHKGVEALENFYIARLHMYRAVYHHKTVTAYTLLLAKAFEELAKNDAEVESMLSLQGLVKTAVSEEFAYLDDSWLLSKILTLARGSGKAAEIARKFLFRRGPKMVYEVIGFGENSVSEKLDEIYNRLVKCVPEESLYVYREVVKIRDGTRPIMVIGVDGEKPVTEESLIISSLPEVMVMGRLYVDVEYVSRARDCMGKVSLKKSINTPRD